MYVYPNLDYFIKSIKDAEICMVFIDFFEKNKAISEKQFWKEKLLDTLIEINNDDYYNYNFHGNIEVKDKIINQASKYFSNDDKEFREFLSITLSQKEKLKPINNRVLKARLNDSKIKVENTSVEKQIIVEKNEFIRLFQSLIYISIEVNSLKFYDAIKILNKQQLENIFEDIVNELLLIDIKLIPIAFNKLISNIIYLEKSFKNRQDYENLVKMPAVKKFVLAKKIAFDIESHRTFDEIMQDFNDNILVDFLKVNFNKGIEFIDYLLDKDNKHPYLIKLFLHYSGFYDNNYFEGQTKILTELLLRLLQINIYRPDEKNAFKAIFVFESGVKNKNIDSTQKFIDKISSSKIKSSVIKVIWNQAHLMAHNAFLIKNITYWKDDKNLLKKYILTCIAEQRNQEIIEIYSLIPSNDFFSIIIQTYIDNENEIQNLFTKFPEDEIIITKIYNECIENKIRMNLEKILNEGDFKKIIPIINLYPNKSKFIEILIESYFCAKQKEWDSLSFITINDISVIIILYSQNHAILKYMLFEKAKRVLILKEDIESLNELENILNLDIWKQTLQNQISN